MQKIKSIFAEIVECYETEFYTEGPCIDMEGNLYFTTLKGEQLCKLTIDGDVIEWARCSYPNGQAILTNGDHLVCDCNGEIVRYSGKGERIRTEASGKIAGIEVKVPCDLVVDGDHGFYFTDASEEGKVFHVRFDGKTNVIARYLNTPNGIVISPDKKSLLVAESYKNRVVRIGLEDVGIPSGKLEVFADLPVNSNPLDLKNIQTTANLPDGLAYDKYGNLWVAHYGMHALQVFDPSGNLLTTLNTGIPATSNLCFTHEFQSVYVTGGINEPGPGRVHKLEVYYS